MHDQWLAEQSSHHAAGEGDVAAHAEHDIRLHLTNGLLRLPEATQQIERQQQLAQETLAAQGAELDPDHLETMLRHQTGFHALRIAQPDDAPAALAHFFGDRKGREDVTTGSAGHDQEGSAHSLPPRINWRFCLWPGCALNLLCKLACDETGNANVVIVFHPA